MGDLEPFPLHAFQHRGGRGGGRGHHVHGMRERTPLRIARIQDHPQHHRRTAHVRHAVLGDCPVDGARLHPAHADARPTDRGQRPREAPPIAVEHRQCPQVDGVVRKVPADDVRQRIEICAAVVIDDPLGVPGGARGVVERDCAPLVVRVRPPERRIALFEQSLVLDVADALAARGMRVVDVDDDRRMSHPGERVRDHRRELPVREQHLRTTVFEDERDGCRVEPDVDGVEHRAEHRHPEARLVDGADVRREDRHAVAGADAACRERGGEAPAARVGLGPGEAALAVDDGEVVRVDGGGAFDKREGRERSEVRRCSAEVRLEWTGGLLCAHSRCSWSESSGVARAVGIAIDRFGANALHAQPVARDSARQTRCILASLREPTKLCSNRCSTVWT